MSKKILVTGGAGFIGTNLVLKLIEQGNEITILDNFHPQIHGNNKLLNEKIIDKVFLIEGSVTDKEIFYNVLKDKEIVIHLAAETGTGQSMYDITGYSNVNIIGTSILCDFLINEEHKIKKVVLSSSRAIYGEGKYSSPDFGFVYPESRTIKSISNSYETKCPISGKYNLTLEKTDENSKIHPASFYGITKQVQEQMLILASKIKQIDCFVLRYQNVYGPGQSLKNPYTGILSIFTRLALQNNTINIFEDGKESRDFVYIDDVVDATIKSIYNKNNGQYILNIGSGISTSVNEVAKNIVNFLKSKSKINISGTFREGDIRHNIADIQLAKKILEFNPQWDFENGIREFLKWALLQSDIPIDFEDYNNSLLELKKRGLIK